MMSLHLLPFTKRRGIELNIKKKKKIREVQFIISFNIIQK